MNVDRRLLAFVVAGLGTAAVALGPLGGDLAPRGQFALATMWFAAVLWVTGAIPLPATALTIPVLLVAFGVYPDATDALRGFADPVIFLMLAGFMLAAGMQARGLDRRVAHAVLARLGSTPERLVLGVMLATAGLSMIVSNTATAAMMLPIALGLVGEVEPLVAADGREGGADTDGAGKPGNLQIATLLGVAYAASLGGVGTIIGTPPNAIVVGQLRSLLGVRITFLDWLVVGLPMVLITLPVAWLLLCRVAYPVGDVDVTRARQQARKAHREAGPLDRRARRALLVFAATAALWFLGGLGGVVGPALSPALHTTLFGGPGESLFGTAGHQGLLYFVLVGLVGALSLLLVDAADWEELLAVDWGTILLLGGGISLANALVDTGATAWLAEGVVSVLGIVPLLVLLLAIVALIVVVGELASNTAMAAILAPLLITLGPTYATSFGTSHEQASVFLAVGGAVAASYGFALPVATPPNAIVFGNGYVGREHMLRAGLLLDLVVIVLAAVTLSLLMTFVWPIFL